MFKYSLYRSVRLLNFVMVEGRVTFYHGDQQIPYCSVLFTHHRFKLTFLLGLSFFLSVLMEVYLVNKLNKLLALPTLTKIMSIKVDLHIFLHFYKTALQVFSKKICRGNSLGNNSDNCYKKTHKNSLTQRRKQQG